MHTVNIGILAHVDAGKTSLTERLLFDTGVIDRLGSVDSGTTQTDTGEIERRRGITIRSAVTAFRVGDRQVNLLDTPGHRDFMAEVERALGVLDGAVLVLSAVEGVQPHTRLLMRTCRALRLPTLLFVNKIDRSGAREAELLADVRRLLTPAIAPLGTVDAIGTAEARFTASPTAMPDWLPLLAEHDNGLLAAYVEDRPVPGDALWDALRTQTAAGLVHPVLFGSALSGTGVPELLDAIGDLLPPAPPPEPEPRARVFAITRGPGGAKVAYARSYGGALTARQRLPVFRRAADGRVESHRAQLTGVAVVGDPSASALTAGYIAALHGLSSVRIGDQIGSTAGLDTASHFPRPSLETVVKRRDGGPATALHAALLRMADEDPLIQARVTASGETGLRLYGEVQKEVIATTLADAYGIAAEFAPSQLIHLERPTGVGNAVEIIGNGFFGTVGLRVEPGTGIEYDLEVELGSLPLAYHKAIEDSVVQTLEQGLCGWPVTDVRVTLTHSGYWSPITVAGDFRDLTPHVLMQALAQAGTRVFEPCHSFEVDVPVVALGPVTSALAHLGGLVDETVPTGAGTGETWRITGSIPARAVTEAQRRLPNLTNGEGLWTSTQAGDRPVQGRPPRRPRTDGNPVDRAEYTRWLAQRDLTTSGGRGK
ncbi:tetracycline resistance protein [Asanoa ishikariensis]|uniref:Ribosomal protection tetracycline resistance protein n=1 Tax=Asanoa ishikariensis TaxID=137265 RepID=A0A1H3QPN3_9ACTN|nr:TetM/TetW/TetO/TetS family tetracycline resistance ribosomal protection protein [Asanoa ishikariensis]GIF64825.1 tetracycline resistance protein [Asanoa ishikariensis]SDZ15233.1 ribosomal protection tetracycline resistance protein [Asanoa ishikariensis]